MSYLLQFDLADDLHHPGCVMCRAARRSADAYLRGLIQSDITDPKVCDDIKRAGGFCREHVLLAVQILKGANDTIGMALLSDLLLQAADERLHRRLAARSPRRAASRRQATRCPVCVAVGVSLDGYVSLLLSGAATSFDHSRQSRGRGLCLPHVLYGLDRPEARHRARYLVGAWKSPAGRLRRYTEELLAKQRLPRQQEPAGDEVRLWSELAQWVAGCSGLESDGTESDGTDARSESHQRSPEEPVRRF